MKQKRGLLIGILAFLLVTDGYAQIFEQKELQATLLKTVEKVYQTSVRIWSYDTVKQQRNGPQFSGVVVSAAGHILTAAHAISSGKVYQVFFPDGKMQMAIGLGRMGFNGEYLPDVAMMKIKGTGVWPFAEMGWSFSLKVNEPCLSISYPNTLDQAFPTLRFGWITAALTANGLFQSTCRMEPGDSGGPMFDYMGRVIGIHSRINHPELENYEVPVDLYRKYWTALNVARDYSAPPMKEDTVTADPLAAELKTIVAPDSLSLKLSAGNPLYVTSRVTLNSKIQEVDKAAYGTLFSLTPVPLKNGAKAGSLVQAKNRSFVVAKGSLVGLDPVLSLPGGPVQAAKIIARDEENDLVLLEVPMELPGGILLKSLAEGPELKYDQLGSFLLSTVASGAPKLSVLSSACFALPTGLNGGNPGGAVEEPIGGKSIRRDGFKSVFAHDGLVTAAECGGPVFNTGGRFYGINIARFSRTSTVAIPAPVVEKWIRNSINITTEKAPNLKNNETKKTKK